MKAKKSMLLFSMMFCMLLLSGCYSHMSEGLYALPKQSDAYYDLQNAIDDVMGSGMAFTGPLSGANQQSVQFVNLDGDTEDEAVIFVKTVGELPLKAYVFDRDGDSYRNIAVMEGEGSDFDAVEYVQLDGFPGMEILLGRRLSDRILQSLTAYTCTDGQMVELMTCKYSEFKTVDLDLDDRKDVFVLRSEVEERAGVAELYFWRDGQVERSKEASASVGAKQIKRIVAGSLEGQIPAVFVASVYEEDTIITDIFALKDSELRNITTGGELGVSAQTVRNYNVYANDIDNDGVIELPRPQALPSYKAGEETQWSIDWYSMDLDGHTKIKMTSYHNYSGGWYLELPQNWHDQITVSRTTDSAGVVGYTVSRWINYASEPEPIFTVYAFTGDRRLEQASGDGRFLLAEKGETAYAASMGECDWAKSLTEEELRTMFRFVYMEWNTGEI